jgi:hypothetical protein
MQTPDSQTPHSKAFVPTIRAPLSWVRCGWRFTTPPAAAARTLVDVAAIAARCRSAIVEPQYDAHTVGSSRAAHAALAGVTR